MPINEFEVSFAAELPGGVVDGEADAIGGNAICELAVTMGGNIVSSFVVVGLELGLEFDAELVLVVLLFDCALVDSVAVVTVPVLFLSYGTVTNVVLKIVVVTEIVDTGFPSGGAIVSPGLPSLAIADQSPSQKASRASKSFLQ